MTAITRRFLLGSMAAVPLAACGPRAKFRSYRGPDVTSVPVVKERRRMYLMHGTETLRAFDVEPGGDPTGPKVQDGDGRTPKGACWIDRRDPNSAYHRSIGVSCPNAADLARAEAMGVRLGGDILIHGAPREASRNDDWTAGCIAISDRGMEHVRAMVQDGTPIHILP